MTDQPPLRWFAQRRHPSRPGFIQVLGYLTREEAEAQARAWGDDAYCWERPSLRTGEASTDHSSQPLITDEELGAIDRKAAAFERAISERATSVESLGPAASVIRRLVAEIRRLSAENQRLNDAIDRQPASVRDDIADALADSEWGRR